MKVTIGIPSYNQSEYLISAIESALLQTIRCEVIVCDDGSTDDSLDVALAYTERVQVISQVNKGLSSARNTIIMNAHGEYILFLDSDDMLDAKCVQRIIEVAEATGADIISPSMQTFGTSNTYVEFMPDPKLEDFKTGNRIAYCSAIKREALLEVGGYSPKMDTLGGWEDYHLWFNLLLRGKRIVTIPERLFYYRTKDDSMWTRTKGREKELWAQIYKDFPKLLTKN